MIVISFDPERGPFTFHTDRLVIKVYGEESLFLDAVVHEREVELGFIPIEGEPQLVTLRLIAPGTWKTVGFI